MSIVLGFSGPRFVPAVFTVATCVSLIQPAFADDAEQERDIKAVRKYLSDPSFKNKTWETGPKRLTNKAIEKAYPGLRFYYVCSSPGAGAKDKNMVSLLVEIDKDGQVSPISFKTGQMKTNGLEDAKTLAAALMSFCLTPRGPVSIDPADVQVGWDWKGWRCQAKKDGCILHASLFNYHDGHYDSITWADPTGDGPAAKP